MREMLLVVMSLLVLNTCLLAFVVYILNDIKRILMLFVNEKRYSFDEDAFDEE